MTDQKPAAPLNAPLARPPAVPPPLAQPLGSGNERAAIGLMVLVCAIFAAQDALSRHLGGAYPPVFVVMLRYWFLAVFCTVMVMRQPGGLRRAIRSKRPVLQVIRGCCWWSRSS